MSHMTELLVVHSFDWCNLSILATFCHKLCPILLPIVPEYLFTGHNKSSRPSCCHVQALQVSLSTYRREFSGCFTTFRKCSVIVHAWFCHLLKRRHIILCPFAVSLNAFFRHDLPYHSSKRPFQRTCFSLWSFSTPSLVGVNFFEQLGFGVNRLEDQALLLFACSLNTLDLFVALDLRSRYFL